MNLLFIDTNIIDFGILFLNKNPPLTAGSDVLFERLRPFGKIGLVCEKGRRFLFLLAFFGFRCGFFDALFYPLVC